MDDYRVAQNLQVELDGVLYSNNVDLLLAGHYHSYERSACGCERVFTVPHEAPLHPAGGGTRTESPSPSPSPKPSASKTCTHRAAPPGSRTGPPFRARAVCACVCVCMRTMCTCGGGVLVSTRARAGRAPCTSRSAWGRPPTPPPPRTSPWGPRASGTTPPRTLARTGAWWVFACTGARGVPGLRLRWGGPPEVGGELGLSFHPRGVDEAWGSRSRRPGVALWHV
jgi:hypothetical protein